MKIVIEVNEQRSVDAVVGFSHHCWEASEGNVDYLDLIKAHFIEITGSHPDDVTVTEST